MSNKNMFNPIIKLNEIGCVEEFRNERLVSVRLVKLISYDVENDEYRFQYDNAFSHEFATVKGNCYPYYEWNSQQDLKHETRFKQIK
jgi:hypothetical protein